MRIPKNTEQLLKAQKSLSNIYCSNGKKPVGVILDVVTRWWSTFNAVERVLYLKKAFLYLEMNGKLDGEYLHYSYLLLVIPFPNVNLSLSSS